MADPAQHRIGLPCGPESLTGFELELLAPRGKSRLDLARALSRAIGGSVRLGFKCHTDGVRGELSPAYAVMDRSGAELLRLMDDRSVHADLAVAGHPVAEDFCVLLDHVPLSLELERQFLSPNFSPQRVLRELSEAYERLRANAADGNAAAAPAPPRLVAGHGERWRVAEVVTRPLRRGERRDVLALILSEARAAGFTIPREAAFHMHSDRQPWLSTARLRRLILAFDAAWSELRRTLRPNPHCGGLGRFDRQLVRCAAATSPSADFTTFRTNLRGAGARKNVDLNILGLLLERPRNPTVEFRCLPMLLDPGRLMRKVRAVEAFLEATAGAC